MHFIYMKEGTTLNPGENIALRDVAQIHSAGANSKEIENILLGHVEDNTVFITAGDVAHALDREDITLMGADACAVSVRKAPQNKWMVFLKTLFVAVLLFIGGGMTVLCYQTDTAMPDVHGVLADVFLDGEQDILWISIPYCVGVGLGVLFFSNMLPGKKKEPTTFEIEQFLSEQEELQYQKANAEEDK